MRFQVFSFTSKKVQRFYSDRKILMSLLSLPFHLQNRVSVFWNFIFLSRDLRALSLFPWNQPHLLRNSDKSLLSPEQSEVRFCRRKAAEDNSAKLNISANVPCTFLLFKATAFLQIFFPRNCLFQQVLRISVFRNSECLTYLYFHSFTYLFL